MAQTVAGLKAFFDARDNVPADFPAVTNQQLTEVDEWLTSVTGIESPTPDDLVDFLYTMLKQQVVSHRRGTTNPIWGA